VAGFTGIGSHTRVRCACRTRNLASRRRAIAVAAVRRCVRAALEARRFVAGCAQRVWPSLRRAHRGADRVRGQWSEKVNMQVIADLCLIPIGIGVSVSREIAECERVLAEAGLRTKLHAYGTNIEGEWDLVFAAIKRCHEVVHAMGAPRISSSLRFGTRIDRAQTMDDKIRSVEEKLGAQSQ